METICIIAGVAVALLAGKLLFRLFFDDSEEFWECVRYSFTPDVFSLFKGEYWDDKFKSLKLGVFLAICIGAGALVFFGLEDFLRSHP